MLLGERERAAAAHNRPTTLTSRFVFYFFRNIIPAMYIYSGAVYIIFMCVYICNYAGAYNKSPAACTPRHAVPHRGLPAQFFATTEHSIY